jgi:hypothetical protein
MLSRRMPLSIQAGLWGYAGIIAVAGFLAAFALSKLS